MVGQIFKVKNYKKTNFIGLFVALFLRHVKNNGSVENS